MVEMDKICDCGNEIFGKSDLCHICEIGFETINSNEPAFESTEESEVSLDNEESDESEENEPVSEKENLPENLDIDALEI